jgi:hypothetical protein
MFGSSTPLCGKQTYKWSDRVRFVDLSKEERKAVIKTVNKRGTDNSGDHSYICTQEVGTMLKCFNNNDWETTLCQAEMTAMYDCVDKHKGDPDPKALSRRWQSSLKAQVFTHFARRKLSWKK